MGGDGGGGADEGVYELLVDDVGQVRDGRIHVGPVRRGVFRLQLDAPVLILSPKEMIGKGGRGRRGRGGGHLVCRQRGRGYYLLPSAAGQKEG